MKWRPIHTILFVGLLFNTLTVSAAPTPYTFYQQGNSTDVSAKTTFGQVFMDTDVDDAFKWMIDKANGGDFLIISTNETDDYNPYLNKLAKSIGKPLNSVSTIILHDPSKAGADPFVIAKIKQAEAVFFTGGNEADYIDFLLSSQALSALNERISQGIPFGGTNAGLAIQGQHIYDRIAAKNQILDSAAALQDPYSTLISTTHHLIATKVNADIVTESHFQQDDRMGRLLTLLARNIQDGFATPDQSKGIAVNEQTALLVEKDGKSKVVVQPGATNPGVFIAKSSESPTVCQSDTPLTFTNVSVSKLLAGSTFNLYTWTGTGAVSYTLDVNNGVITSSSGNIYGD